MAGTLYIVATPIGNLEDMPPRVAATFGAADFIAAEDTRVTMKLLNYLGLKKPMVSYYEHALQKGEAILQRIEAGESCALCSDAGMPCVSEQRANKRLIWAQSADIARAVASICHHEQALFGVMSGHGKKILSLSVVAQHNLRKLGDADDVEEGRNQTVCVNKLHHPALSVVAGHPVEQGAGG